MREKIWVECDKDRGDQAANLSEELARDSINQQTKRRAEDRHHQPCVGDHSTRVVADFVKELVCGRAFVRELPASIIQRKQFRIFK